MPRRSRWPLSSPVLEYLRDSPQVLIHVAMKLNLLEDESLIIESGFLILVIEFRKYIIPYLLYRRHQRLSEKGKMAQ